MLIFVMGVDGYIGNAITQALLNQGHDVVGFDNLWRREWINEMNSKSAIPIFTMRQKELMFNEYFRTDVPFIWEEIDVALQPNLLELWFKDYKPDVVINLAHNPSGPYSMISRKHSEKVLINNIIGTNNILWYIKESVPDCHYITIGTAGEYDHYSNIDIEEGYIKFEHNGRQSNEMIYPRRPGSVYHTSKTSSTYLIDYLTRAWNLKCTDLMQGVVFGSYTDEIDETQIYSRLDSDEAGGTVINRFILQAILDIPLTIYGEGKHKRSFLSLNDCIQALMIAVDNPPTSGRVQVWNQLSEWHSMNDIADKVINVAKKMKKMKGKLKINIPTPRKEHTGDHYYNFKTDILKNFGYAPTRTIEEEIIYTMEILLPIKEQLEVLRNVVNPRIIFRRE